MIFVDTSAWVAFFDAASAGHKAVADHLETARRLVTSTFVLDETATLVQARAGHRHAVHAGRFLRTSGAVDLVTVTRADLDAAWALFEAREDKEYSLTDCTGFVVMRRLGIETAVTLDQDFRREGFETVPA